MRVIIVLVILALALVATIVMRKEREANFDHRFEQTEKRIRDMAEDIDDEFEDSELGS